MFTLSNITSHTFSYSCECGAIGRCIFIPVTTSGTLVMDLKCPMCEAKEHIRIWTDDIDNDNLRWALVLDNDLIGRDGIDFEER